VNNVKNFIPVLSSKNMLSIGPNASFGKTLKKINHNKKADVVWVQKPNPSQMSAILTARLAGKKFLWIQSFSNPPIPGLFTKLLLNQSDILMVTSKKMAAKVRGFGVNKPKIRIQ
jgi:hypothetical protein